MSRLNSERSKVKKASIFILCPPRRLQTTHPLPVANESRNTVSHYLSVPLCTRIYKSPRGQWVIMAARQLFVILIPQHASDRSEVLMEIISVVQ